MSSFAARAASPTHPCLPQGMTISHVIELVDRVAGQLGFGGPRRAALLRMIRQTAPADWIDPSRDPVCYRPQQDLAQDLGITDRAMRAHERAIEQAGLLIVDTTANGRRSGRVLSDGRRLGLNFRPLIDRIDWLRSLDQEHQEACRRIAELRLECSAAKRDARKFIETLLQCDPKHPALPDLLQRLASWPRRYSGFRTAEALEEHMAEVLNLVSEVDQMLSCRTDSSGRAEARIPAIQNTNLNNFVICSGSSAKIRPARKRADTNSSATMPNGTVASIENKYVRGGRGHKPEYTDTFPPRQLYLMASDDMRMYLDARERPDRLTDRDFIGAAIASLVDLGISPSAWEDAAETMGNLAAALSVLVVDANRFRDVGPVRKPGAMLRAMTRIAARGGLNLHGSLIALKQWKIYGSSDC